MVRSSLLVLSFFIFLSGAALAATPPKEAEPATREVQKRLLGTLPFKDTRDFENARRGFIAQMTEPEIRDANGRVLYSLKDYSFINDDGAPATVNPSLWRQAMLNLEGGLFEVTDRIHQIRALDISNMTIIRGDTGLIIIDPLLSKETAAAGLALYREHVSGPDGSPLPVKAVIYTHSHTDHYGGVKGVVSEEDVLQGKAAILAPEGFMEAAVSENVLAGNAMSRRATYMYGMMLPRNARGQVDTGLGKATSRGELTLIAPTDTIRKTGEQRTIDGVIIEFQMAPDTEAPAEMLLYFPQFKALCAAEDACRTLHNLYTLRGAQVRDANKWWQTLDESIDRYAGRTEVIFAQHHWPLWGKSAVAEFLFRQRNAYKYLHDQTLRLANHGYTPNEISEELRYPDSLASLWHMRDYYGTVSHNAKAVYQRYLGWYDGNPANLNPLPPAGAGKRYVDYMGGAGAVLAKARQSYMQGEYRWVAEVLKHVVFSDPENMEARELQADALEQLGYQAEAATWRNAYLMAAFELRNKATPRAGKSTASRDVINAMSVEMVLEYLSVRLNGPRAEGAAMRINWMQAQGKRDSVEKTDAEDTYALSVEDCVLLYKKGRPHATPDATLYMPRLGLAGIASGATTLEQELASGRAVIDGDADHVKRLFDLLDSFEVMFPIVTP